MVKTTGCLTLPEWRKYATKEHLPKYLELIGDQMGKELSRACEIIQKSVLQIDPEADWERIAWDREDSDSALAKWKRSGSSRRRIR